MVLRFAFLFSLTLFVSCAGQRRHLSPVTGNEFTLFPVDRRTPERITCHGETDARFACFAKELEAGSRSLDVAGALTVTTPDGKTNTFTHTDELNQAALKVSKDTQFPAGSITKMFLAAAAVSLSQEGALDLHTPIFHYLPELKPNVGVGSVTLHQLMTHTSGLGNPQQCESAAKGEAAVDDLPDLLKTYGHQPLWAPPGAVFNYSNLGYSFVALVIERVTGAPFETAVKERVLIPAGIGGATFGPDRGAVRGHRSDDVQIAPRCRAMWPSGGLMLSVTELDHWGRNLTKPDASKLGRPLVETLTAPHVLTGDRPGATYGYGVVRFEHSGVMIYTHSGRLEDFSAFLAWSPDRGASVAAFANRSEMVVVRAGFRALSTFLFLSEDWQPPSGSAFPLSAYVGDYVDRVGTLGRVRVSLEGEELTIDYLDGPPPLLPANFRFVFEPGAPRARYIVTPVGVGTRQDQSSPH